MTVISSSSSFSNNPVVVFDSGSYNTHIGYGGNLEPSIKLASAVGKKRTSTNVSGSNNKSPIDSMCCSVGGHDMVLENASNHDFNFMIRQGIIQDWDAMQQFWHTCIYEKLRCNPEDHCFLMTESEFNSPENREQMAEIMFETYNVPGMYIAAQPILSLVASWGCVDSQRQQLSGTVVDSGDGTTTIIPVYDGHVLRSGIQQIPLGGRDITSYIQDRLRQNKRNVPPSQSFEIARRIKEGYGYVCSNIEKEKAKGATLTESVGGKYFKGKESWKCTVDEEKYLSGEVLFQPNLLLKNNGGNSNNNKSQFKPLPNLVDTTIQQCPIDIRRVLYNNIVLSGGTTMFPDFGRRLQRDLKKLVNMRLQQERENAHVIGDCGGHENHFVDVNVISHSSQNHAAWLGGSIVASDSRFSNWIKTKQDYEEEGLRIFRSTTAGIFY